MREIHFRGKTITNRTWVHGGYVRHIGRTPCPIGDSVKPEDIHHLIIRDGFSDWNMPRALEVHEVASNTVGQFTEIDDKNDNPIYEDDILKFDDRLCRVCWHQPSGSWDCMPIKGPYDDKFFVVLHKGSTANWHRYAEVVGNIHDNPELLGAK